MGRVLARRHLRALLLPSVVAVLSVPTVAHAATMITGETLTTNETWTPAGNPYLISGDIVVPPCLTLTIEAGVDIQLLPGTYKTTSTPGYVSFLVSGSIVIDGSETAPVVFEPGPGTMPTGTAWEGVFFLRGSTGSHIQYAHLIRPLVGLLFENASTTNTITRTRITDASIGVQSGDGTLVLDGIVVDGAFQGVLAASRAHLVNCAFIGNGDGVGIDVEQNQTMRSSFINVSVENFAEGFRVSLGAVTVVNSIVSNSPSPFYQVSSDFLTLNLANDDIYPADPGVDCPSCFSRDPQYVAPRDLHLQPTSPCIDSGTSTWAPAHDGDGTPRPLGGSWDVGAFEYSSSGDAGVGGPGFDMLPADTDGGVVCVPWGPADLAIYTPFDLASAGSATVDMSIPVTSPGPPDASVPDASTPHDAAAANAPPDCKQNGCKCSFSPSARSSSAAPLVLLLALIAIRRGRR